jgi:ABC-type nitrate/sulfonate/bicarbonate transport system permease component
LNKATNKNIYYYLTGYFILWIILFEFLLPVNNILPKPSIVLESFDDLWRDYNLLINYLSTISVIYISMAAAYFILRLIRVQLLMRNNVLANLILSLEWFSEYVPGIVIGLILIYWFPNSEYIEFVFAFATVFISLLIKFQIITKELKQEYIDAAYSLGAGRTLIAKSVIWKSAEPALIEHLYQIHLYIWAMLIAFEFIKGGLGLGMIFRRALEFSDLSVLFSSLLITGITIFLGSLMIKSIKNKFFFWGFN